MDEQVIQTIYLISRYVHIVATTLLVGGTLFYEAVVPVAIDDLREGQQLSVFARARWTFKGIVWISAVLLLISGAIFAYRNTYAYFGDELRLIRWGEFADTTQPGVGDTTLSVPGWWAVAHMALGLVTIAIALVLVSGRTPPRRPIGWMRLNLLLLLIVIFLASTTHHVRLKRVLPVRGISATPAPAWVAHC
jgi:hypothetical protein